MGGKEDQKADTFCKKMKIMSSMLVSAWVNIRTKCRKRKRDCHWTEARNPIASKSKLTKVWLALNDKNSSSWEQRGRRYFIAKYDKLIEQGQTHLRCFYQRKTLQVWGKRSLVNPIQSDLANNSTKKLDIRNATLDLIAIQRPD